MEIQIPYGEEKLTLRIPDHNLIGVIKPASISPAENINVLKEKMAESLKTFLAKARSVLVIVNDYTRQLLENILIRQ